MGSKLITGNTWFAGMTRRNEVRTIPFELWRQAVLKPLFVRFRIEEAGYDDKAPPVMAFVNHGNWIVACPDCRGAEFAWEEGWFFCCSCFNSSLGHKYRRSVFPMDRAKIEELLAVRPLTNRNWTHDETVAYLKRENRKHSKELLKTGNSSKGGIT